MEANKQMNMTDQEQIKTEDALKDLLSDRNINHKLYPHQREGVAFLFNAYKNGKSRAEGGRNGAILADEMGLGKSIQVIIFLHGMIMKTQEFKNALLVVPCSLLIDWKDKVNIWSPSMNTFIYHYSDKERLRKLKSLQKNGGIGLISYKTYISHYKTITTYKDQPFVWDCLIFDEAHKLKNPATKTHKIAANISAGFHILITGTPLQNNLKEFWSLFSLISDTFLLGTYKTFKHKFENPIIKGLEADSGPEQRALGMELQETLKRITEPFLLRRRKDQIEDTSDPTLLENTSSEVLRLPKKNEYVIWIKLSPEQEAAYCSIIDNSYSLTFQTIHPLLVACTYPRLTSDNLEYKESGIHVAESGKLTVMLALLEMFSANGNFALVFSNYTKVLDVIQKALTQTTWGKKAFLRIDGQNISQRDEIVKRFQKRRSKNILLLTTSVGAEGLTLTAADSVVFADISWNQSQDAQAVGRSHRIGQTKDVKTYRLITCGTLEETMYRRQLFRGSLTRQVVGDEQNPFRHFTQNQLKGELNLRETHFSSTQKQLEKHGAKYLNITDIFEGDIYSLCAASVCGISDHGQLLKASQGEDLAVDMARMHVVETAKMSQQEIKEESHLIRQNFYDVSVNKSFRKDKIRRRRTRTPGLPRKYKCYTPFSGTRRRTLHISRPCVFESDDSSDLSADEVNLNEKTEAHILVTFKSEATSDIVEQCKPSNFMCNTTVRHDDQDGILLSSNMSGIQSTNTCCSSPFSDKKQKTSCISRSYMSDVSVSTDTSFSGDISDTDRCNKQDNVSLGNVQQTSQILIPDVSDLSDGSNVSGNKSFSEYTDSCDDQDNFSSGNSSMLSNTHSLRSDITIMQEDTNPKASKSVEAHQQIQQIQLKQEEFSEHISKSIPNTGLDKDMSPVYALDNNVSSVTDLEKDVSPFAETYPTVNTSAYHEHIITPDNSVSVPDFKDQTSNSEYCSDQCNHKTSVSVIKDEQSIYTSEDSHMNKSETNHLLETNISTNSTTQLSIDRAMSDISLEQSNESKTVTDLKEEANSEGVKFIGLKEQNILMNDDHEEFPKRFIPLDSSSHSCEDPPNSTIYVPTYDAQKKTALNEEVQMDLTEISSEASFKSGLLSNHYFHKLCDYSLTPISFSTSSTPSAGIKEQNTKQLRELDDSCISRPDFSDCSVLADKSFSGNISDTDSSNDQDNVSSDNSSVLSNTHSLRSDINIMQDSELGELNTFQEDTNPKASKSVMADQQIQQIQLKQKEFSEHISKSIPNTGLDKDMSPVYALDNNVPCVTDLEKDVSPFAETYPTVNTSAYHEHIITPDNSVSVPDFKDQTSNSEYCSDPCNHKTSVSIINDEQSIYTSEDSHMNKSETNHLLETNISTNSTTQLSIDRAMSDISLEESNESKTVTDLKEQANSEEVKFIGLKEQKVIMNDDHEEFPKRCIALESSSHSCEDPPNSTIYVPTYDAQKKTALNEEVQMDLTEISSEDSFKSGLLTNHHFHKFCDYSLTPSSFATSSTPSAGIKEHNTKQLKELDSCISRPDFSDSSVNPKASRSVMADQQILQIQLKQKEFSEHISKSIPNTGLDKDMSPVYALDNNVSSVTDLEKDVSPFAETYSTVNTSAYHEHIITPDNSVSVPDFKDQTSNSEYCSDPCNHKTSVSIIKDEQSIYTSENSHMNKSETNHLLETNISTNSTTQLSIDRAMSDISLEQSNESETVTDLKEEANSEGVKFIGLKEQKVIMNDDHEEFPKRCIALESSSHSCEDPPNSTIYVPTYDAQKKTALNEEVQMDLTEISSEDSFKSGLLTNHHFHKFCDYSLTPSSFATSSTPSAGIKEHNTKQLRELDDSCISRPDLSDSSVLADKSFSGNISDTDSSNDQDNVSSGNSCVLSNTHSPRSDINIMQYSELGELNTFQKDTNPKGSRSVMADQQILQIQLKQEEFSEHISKSIPNTGLDKDMSPVYALDNNVSSVTDLEKDVSLFAETYPTVNTSAYHEHIITPDNSVSVPDFKDQTSNSEYCSDPCNHKTSVSVIKDEQSIYTSEDSHMNKSETNHLLETNISTNSTTQLSIDRAMSDISLEQSNESETVTDLKEEANSEGVKFIGLKEQNILMNDDHEEFPKRFIPLDSNSHSCEDPPNSTIYVPTYEVQKKTALNEEVQMDLTEISSEDSFKSGLLSNHHFHKLCDYSLTPSSFSTSATPSARIKEHDTKQLRECDELNVLQEESNLQEITFSEPRGPNKQLNHNLTHEVIFKSNLISNESVHVLGHVSLGSTPSVEKEIQEHKEHFQNTPLQSGQVVHQESIFKRRSFSHSYLSNKGNSSTPLKSFCERNLRESDQLKRTNKRTPGLPRKYKRFSSSVAKTGSRKTTNLINHESYSDISFSQVRKTLLYDNKVQKTLLDTENKNDQSFDHNTEECTAKSSTYRLSRTKLPKSTFSTTAHSWEFEKENNDGLMCGYPFNQNVISQTFTPQSEKMTQTHSDQRQLNNIQDTGVESAQQCPTNRNTDTYQPDITSRVNILLEDLLANVTISSNNTFVRKGFKRLVQKQKTQKKRKGCSFPLKSSRPSFSANYRKHAKKVLQLMEKVNVNHITKQPTEKQFQCEDVVASDKEPLYPVKTTEQYSAQGSSKQIITGKEIYDIPDCRDDKMIRAARIKAEPHAKDLSTDFSNCHESLADDSEESMPEQNDNKSTNESYSYYGVNTNINEMFFVLEKLKRL